MSNGASSTAVTATRGWRSGRLLCALVLVAGVAASVTVVVQLQAQRRSTAERVLDQRTELARRVVAAELSRYVDGVRMVAVAASAYQPLTRAKYLVATAALVEAKLAGASSVTFIVPVPGGRVAAEEEFWRKRGATGLRFQPAGPRSEHQFSVFSASLDGKAPAVMGVDVAQFPAPSAALAEARQLGVPVVSDTYRFYRDRDLPQQAQQSAFVLAAPVYDLPDAAGARAFRGWIVIGLRSGDFLGGTLRDVTQGVMDASLSATNSGGQQIQVAALAGGGRPADLHRQADIQVSDRQWTLRTAATVGALAAGTAELVTTGVGGVLFSLLLSGLVLVLATGRSRAQVAVAEATRELGDAEREARRQANLLTVVVDRITDGVMVVDQQGAFVVQNPTARLLLGVEGGAGDPAGWQAHFGAFRADRTTVFPSEELPLARAMSGEASDDVEVFIRNATRPDGSLLAVSARPLDVGGARQGAVAVFRDVTTQRQHEAALAAANERLATANKELEAFSYSVSHDLRGPLRRMDGFASILLEDHAGDLPAEASNYLGRIRASALRMGALIDDLLAFSRLGRQELVRQHVEPAEIARAALTQLADEHAGQDVQVTIADLPGCSADPALLEQVYVNLLSNALKFSRDRDPAVIDVGWHAESEHVVYTVVDNGAGFDPRYADKLFGVFQRLHTGDEYEGTGVGLALVQRIVRRHGGRIWAHSQPGQGATFMFTITEKTSA